MNKYIPLYISLLFLSACSGKGKLNHPDALVQVDNKILYKAEINKQIPSSYSKADSTLFAESLIKQWIKQRLINGLAKSNLGNEMDNIDKLVEEYRNSLLRNRYESKIVAEKLTSSISEADLITYYDEHPDEFILDKSIIKGLFLKIPINAPNFDKIKKWYKSNKVEDLENIEKYSLQNAVIYEYFYDKWTDFGSIMDNIPIQVSNPKLYLKNNKTIEYKDSLFHYLLNINQYLADGDTAPFDYTEPHIREILTNQKKVTFIHNFETEMYNEALKEGKIHFFETSKNMDNNKQK